MTRIIDEKLKSLQSQKGGPLQGTLKKIQDFAFFFKNQIQKYGLDRNGEFYKSLLLSSFISEEAVKKLRQFKTSPAFSEKDLR